MTTPRPGVVTPLTARSQRIKDLRKLSRRSERTERRLFLADGPKAVQAALERGVATEVLLTAAAGERFSMLLDAAPRTTYVDEQALASLSDSVSPAGVVAVCSFFDVSAEEALSAAGRPGPALVTIAADVRDPGNAGTLLRSSDALGAHAVLLAGHSVDPYNPKTVRASVGSLFHLPVALEPDPARAVTRSQEAGLAVLAADGDGELTLDDVATLLTAPLAWLFGNEAWGLPSDLAGLADHRVRVPLQGRAESLNLAAAAAICLHETVRVRRAAR